MSEIDFKKIVGELNDLLYKSHGETEHSFSWTTTDFVDIISFDEYQLWNSENDSRIWMEAERDYEPFLPFIKREFNNYVTKLSLMRFKRVPPAPKDDWNDE